VVSGHVTEKTLSESDLDGHSIQLMSGLTQVGRIYTHCVSCTARPNGSLMIVGWATSSALCRPNVNDCGRPLARCIAHPYQVSLYMLHCDVIAGFGSRKKHLNYNHVTHLRIVENNYQHYSRYVSVRMHKSVPNEIDKKLCALKKTDKVMVL